MLPAVVLEAGLLTHARDMVAELEYPDGVRFQLMLRDYRASLLRLEEVVAALQVRRAVVEQEGETVPEPSTVPESPQERESGV